MKEDKLLICVPKEKRGPAEACVSFTRKFNLQNYGGPAYESIEIFGSRKVQCAPEDLEQLSQELHEECMAEVEAFARQYLIDMKRKLDKATARAATRKAG